MKNKIILVCMLSVICSLQSKPIILWDIHDVLTVPRDRFVEFIRFPHHKQLFSRLSWPFIKELIAISPQFFTDLSSEELIHIALKYNNPFLAELITTIANAQDPVIGMKEIVNELADMGYEQHVASNIGFISFHRLINPKKYPQIAPLFKHFDINKSMVVSNEQGKFIAKPQPLFFKRYLEKNSINLDTQPVLFIDDRPANIRVAKKLGFDTIRFKNPQQLREALRTKGIMVKAPTHHFSSQREHHPLYHYRSFVRAANRPVLDDSV